MAKTLSLVYSENGKVNIGDRIYAFDNENLSPTIGVTIPAVYSQYTFVMDCKNGVSTKQIELGTGATSYTFSLDNSLTLAGVVEFQLWATILSGTDTVKVQWQKYLLTINKALNLYTITAESNPDIIATHTSQIAELFSITSVLDTDGDGSKFLADDGTYKAGTYDDLDNKPSINNVELSGNKTSSDLGLQPAGSYLTVEVDPTVSSWAKESTKPSYLVSEITGYETLKTYAGFVNRTDSTISVNSSGMFSISGDYTFYVNGVKYVKSGVATTFITADQTLTYIFFNSQGYQSTSNTIWDITSGANIPVAICFKDGSTYALTDERHGHERNKAWHNWAHMNIGAMYRSGLSGTFGNTTLSVTQGVIYDEDIRFDTGGTKTTTSLWYRNATSGMRLVRGATACKSVSGGGVLQYDNGSGTLQDVSLNRYTTNWVYASNDATEPIYTVIGQNNSANLTSARNASAPTINLSTTEWKLIYKVIYQRNNGTPAGVFVESTDYRAVQTGVPTSSVITDHSTLINRDASNSHPASAISYDDGGDVLTNVQTELAGRLNKTYTLDILTSDWSTNSFTQSVTGLVDADFVSIQSTDSYYLDYGLSYTQSGSSITFTVTVKPLITLTIGIAVTKAVSGGAL